MPVLSLGKVQGLDSFLEREGQDCREAVTCCCKFSQQNRERMGGKVACCIGKPVETGLGDIISIRTIMEVKENLGDSLTLFSYDRLYKAYI